MLYRPLAVVLSFRQGSEAGGEFYLNVFVMTVARTVCRQSWCEGKDDFRWWPAQGSARCAVEPDAASEDWCSLVAIAKINRRKLFLYVFVCVSVSYKFDLFGFASLMITYK